MRALLVLATLAFAVFAGCSSSPPPKEETTPADFEDLGLQATSTTGVIRGVVVDDAIRPIAKATVTLRGTTPQSVTTKDDGAFGFDGLEAGTYFLSIHKLGYLDVQQSADVVAGVAEPNAVKVQLKSDGKAAPYAVAYTVEGIVECGTSVIAACGGVHDGVVIVCVQTGVCLPQPTNDAYSAFLQIDGGVPDYIQSEMVWDTTQTLGDSMNYALRYADRATYDNGMYIDQFDSFEGPSPLLGHVSGDDAKDADLGNTTGLVFSIFSGGSQGTPAGATLEQRYTFYIHTFYGYLPPEGWRFTDDGTVPPPQ